MECKQDLITLYRLYLFALQTREEFGTQYGDTDELIEQYEEKLKIKSLRKEIKGE